MKGHDHRDGFTLIELMVVLAVLAIITILALPYSSRSAEGRRLVAFSQVVAVALRQARLEAISGNVETVVRFDLDRRVVIAGAHKRVVIIPEDVTLTIITSSGELKEREAGFRFYPDGSATGGHILLKRGGEQWTVAVNWLTGHVARTTVSAQ